MSAQILFFCWIVALTFVISVNGQSKEQDRIKIPLPGMTFQYDHKQYSGFLNVPSKNNLFYWFLESQGNTSQDPLVLWLVFKIRISNKFVFPAFRWAS
jgi:serine carboxypeptidase-like clade 1